LASRSARASADQFLTVKELALRAGVAGHVVRFYARAGLIRAARQAANGYRQFTQHDVKSIRFIRAAQSLGFTLAEVREVFRHSRRGETPCPRVRDIIDLRLAENRERLEYVRALQERMQQARDLWQRMPNQVPRGDSLCALIEAVSIGDSGPPPRGLRIA